MRWMIGPRLHRRFGVFVNVLARVLVQTKPHAFVAQVDAILDAQRRAAVRAAAGHRADARRHRLAGHAHAARRRRGARGADHDVAALRAARRRARPHGRGAERVQRRRAEVPRRDRPPASARPGIGVARQLDGAGGEVMLAPPRDLAAELHTDSRATRSRRRLAARRGSSSRPARRRRRTRGGARRTRPVRPREPADQLAVRSLP